MLVDPTGIFTAEILKGNADDAPGVDDVVRSVEYAAFPEPNPNRGVAELVIGRAGDDRGLDTLDRRLVDDGA